MTVFVVTRVWPGDPVLVKAGAYATPEVRAAISKELGLDEPFLVQLVNYVGDVQPRRSGREHPLGHPVREDI